MVLASVAADVFKAILQGTPPGAVYALIALGFVLTYKTAGVFNLAFGAQAYVAAAMFYKAHIEWGWNRYLSVFIAVFVLSPFIGLVLERLIFRQLRTASSVSKLVITIGLTVALPELFKLVFRFGTLSGRAPEPVIDPGRPTAYYDPFGQYPWSRNEILQMVVGLVGVVLLGALFKFSAIGLRMRAVVESPRMTELAGIHADRVSAFAWILSSTMAGAAGVLIAPKYNSLDPGQFFNLVVVAVAAAAIGKLTSLPRAMAGAFALGIFIALFNTYIPRWAVDHAWLDPIQEVTPALPFLVLFGILVFWPAIRRSRDAIDPLSGVDPPPPALAALERSPELTRRIRITFAVFAVAAFVFVMFFVPDEEYWIPRVTDTVIMSIIFCSVVVITGIAGQISLCQASFGAVGAFSVFQLVDRYDMSVLLAAVIGAFIAAAVGVILSLPVLRLGGIWLAIATLAFAFFFDAVAVKLPFVGGGDTSLLQGTQVPRPTIGGIDFAAPRSFLLLCLVILTIVGFGVIQLREGTIGRTLRAIRGSEVAAQSIGIDVAKARIIAFAVSAFIAGLGGALLASHQGSVNYGTNFTPLPGLFWLVIVVTLGPRTVEGAIQAGIGFALFDPLILKRFLPWLFGWTYYLPGFFEEPGIRTILFGLSAVQFARHPEGLLEYGKRRSMAKQQAKLDARRAAQGAPGGPVPEAVGS